MKVKDQNSSVVFIATLTRIAISFCLSIFFNLICFGLLRAAESFLPLKAVWLLSRIIWWPVAISCGVDPEDLFCALPGLIFSLLFYWFVAFALLWWRKWSQPEEEFVALSLR